MSIVRARLTRLSDLPGLLLSGRRVEQLRLPLVMPFSRGDLLRVARPHPGQAVSMRLAVATVNGQVAAWLAYAPHTDPHAWRIEAAGAGNRRLRPADDVSSVLWCTLIEFAIADAGAHGARRLFAAAVADSPGWHALHSAGFEMYGYATQLRGIPDVDRAESPAGFRAQEASDVWGIQQLYQRSTPRVVQFAEARISREWELAPRTVVDRVRGAAPRARTWVVEQQSEMTTYCRLEQVGRTQVITWIAQPEQRDEVVPTLLASLRAAGGGRRQSVVLVPGHHDDLLHEFEAAGFTPEYQADLMVRPTTVTNVIRARPLPIPIERRERLVGSSPSALAGRTRRRQIPGGLSILRTRITDWNRC